MKKTIFLKLKIEFTDNFKEGLHVHESQNLDKALNSRHKKAFTLKLAAECSS